MIPVFFLQSDEDNRHQNWTRLKSIKEHAILVNSTGTIFESHKNIAETCLSDKFYVVDGDSWILDSFDFNVDVDMTPRSVAVFRARNPINGLVYGHGGIKLFSKDCFDPDRLDSSDMTTSLADSYIVVNTLASEHRFNYSAFSAWRTAFRETVKLSSGTIKNQVSEETVERLHCWLTVGAGKQYGTFCLEGAKHGVEYIKLGKPLNAINDFRWLEEEFKRIYE